MDESRIAHTGEHILFRALFKVFPGLVLDKIDVVEGRKVVYVESAEQLSWEKLLEAELLANEVIADGKIVRKHAGSTEELKEKFGGKLRGKWERITDETVTVVEVDGYDWAACSGDHVENTIDIGMILITKVNSLGKEKYEIHFEVGEAAKQKALDLHARAKSVIEILGTTEDKLEKAAMNLKDEALMLRKKLKSVSKEALKNIAAENVNGIKIFAKIFPGLDNDELTARAGELVREKNTAVIFVNEFEEKIIITVARSDDLQFNAVEILQEVCEQLGGKGGGKPSFAMGGGKKTVSAEKILSDLKSLVMKNLRI
jgi:alanyl-tRNA synthetase